MKIEGTPTDQHFRLCLLNPWSVCNKADVINDFIIEHDLEVLALTETWLTGTSSDGPVISALLPDGYNIISAPRGSRGGGTVITHHQSLKLSRTYIGPAKTSFEVLECTINSPSAIRLCIIYRPPNQTNVTTFLDEISDYLSNVSLSSGQLLVLGNFNLHVDDCSNSRSNDFLSSLSSLGLQQHVKTSTHRNGHILDLVLTPQDSSLILTCVVQECGFPDHFPIFMQVAAKKPDLPRKKITYRKTKSITQESLHAALLSSHLSDPTLQELSIADAIITYQQGLESVMNSLARLRTVEITIRPEANWFTDEIRSAKQVRRRMERLWRKTGLTVHREMYLVEERRVCNLIHCAKKAYYNSQVTACKGDQRCLFSVVNKLLGRSESSPLPSGDPPILNCTGVQ